METNISKVRSIVDKFIHFTKRRGTDNLSIVANWDFEVTRFNGDVERHSVSNTMTNSGLAQLAALGISNTASAFLYLGVGTQTAASSLGSALTGAGEVIRKLASTAASSREYMVLVCTLAGATDSVTSVDLRTAYAINHPDSGSGIPLNFVNSVATILADSDFLRLQMNVRVGSHNI